MRKLTKILAVALSLALLVCGLVIAASADDASAQETYLVSETGQVLDTDATSIDYAAIDRSVMYFYAPTGVTVSNGYIVNNTTDAKEGYDRFVRIAYAIYDAATGDLISAHESVFVSLADNFTENASKQSTTAAAIIVLYQDLDLHDCPIQSSSNKALIPATKNMLIDLNGYELKKTSDNVENTLEHLGLASNKYPNNWRLFNCATGSRYFGVTSSYPGGSIKFYQEGYETFLFNGQSSGATGNYYYLGDFVPTGQFKAYAKKTLYHVDAIVGGVSNNTNTASSHKTSGYALMRIENATVTQIDNCDNEAVFHCYTRMAIQFDGAKVYAADGKSVFNLTSTGTNTSTSGKDVFLVNNSTIASTIKKSILSGKYIFKELDYVDTKADSNGNLEVPGMKITSTLLDGVLYGATPQHADYITLGYGCATTVLPEGYEAYITLDNVAFIEADATAGGKTVPTIIGTVSEDGVYTVQSSIPGLSIAKDGYTVTVDGTTFTITPNKIIVKDAEGNVTEYDLPDDAYAALKTGYFIDSMAAVGAGVIDREVAYFYVNNAVELDEYILSDEATDGYYLATRAAYVIYNLDGTVYSKSTDATNFVQPLINALSSSGAKSCRVVLYADINLNNDQTQKTTSMFTVRAGETLIVDLNGYYLGKHGVPKMSNSAGHGMFILTPNGDTTSKTTLTLVSSYEGGKLEYKCSDDDYNTIVNASSSYATGCTVNFGGFEGTNGDNLTVMADNLVWHTLSANDTHRTRQYLNPLAINVKGGHYYAVSGSSAGGCNVFTLRTVAVVDIENAEFHTVRAFLYAQHNDVEAYVTANIKNTYINATSNGSTVRTIVSVPRHKGVTYDAMVATGLELSEEQLATLKAAYESDNAFRFENCTLIGELYTSEANKTSGNPQMTGTITLAGENMLLGLDAGNTDIDVAGAIEAGYVVIEDGTSSVKAKVTHKINLTIPYTENPYVYSNESRTFIYATYYTKDKDTMVGHLIYGDEDMGEWLVGTTLGRKPSAPDGVKNVYSYKFAGWANEAGEIVTAVAAGENKLTSTFELVANVSGFGLDLTTLNGFIINLYVPKNDAIAVGEGAVESGKYYVYSLPVAPGSTESIEVVLTVTDGTQTATQTVKASLLDYFNAALEQHAEDAVSVSLVVNAVNYCNEVHKFLNEGAGVEAYETILANEAYADCLISYENDSDEAVNTLASEVVTGITVFVDGENSAPYLALVLSESAEVGATYMIGGVEHNVACDVKYVGDVLVAVFGEMPVYDMAAIMNVTVNGEAVGSINLAYYVTNTTSDAIANATYGFAIAVYNYKTQPTEQPAE